MICCPPCLPASHTDLDVVWLDNPLPFLLSYSDADVLFSPEDWDKKHKFDEPVVKVDTSMSSSESHVASWMQNGRCRG